MSLCTADLAADLAAPRLLSPFVGATQSYFADPPLSSKLFSLRSVLALVSSVQPSPAALPIKPRRPPPAFPIWRTLMKLHSLIFLKHLYTSC